MLPGPEDIQTGPEILPPEKPEADLPPQPTDEEPAFLDIPDIYDPAEEPALVYDPNMITLTDHTSLNVSAAEYLSREFTPVLAQEGPSVLIVHTHGSEAYTPTEKNSYVPSDPDRTENKNYNMIRVGDLVEGILDEAGIGVVHDRELYDYPSYSGSYTRSLEAIETALEKYPDISVVLDLHRDSALDPDGSSHKTTVEFEGVTCSQVMLVVGTGEGGLPHPDWEENFRFALELQTVMQNRYPGLARGIDLRTERFNQHATHGSLIVEIGYSGNTLEEALAAAERFAACLAEVLKAGEKIT